ncbi:MAG: HAMP domain-containing sensor histidine kinase [Chloroflexota bacterium]
MTRLRSLRWRLAAVYAAVAAVMLVVVLTVVANAVETALIRSAAERLTIEAGLIAAETGPGRSGPRATDLAAGELATVLGGRGTAVVILDPSGATLAAQGNGAAPAVLDARLAAADYAAVVAQGMTIDAVEPLAGGGRALIVAAPVQLRAGGPGGGVGQGRGQGNGRGLGNQGDGRAEAADGPANAVAQLAISLDAIDASLADLRLRLALLGAGMLVAAVVVAWLLTRLGLRALERVTGAADRIAAGDLDARAALPAGTDEVGRLGRAFDGMAERVDATLTAQRQFAADASHELRTPLTVLGGYVDVLAAGDLDPETRTRTLGAMRREIDRLSRLSNDLLLLTQLEAGGGRLAPRVLDLGELVEDIAAAARVIGPDRRVEVVRDGTLPVVADPDRLTQALMNLVDNAVRHTQPGGTIRLTATRTDGLAVAEVSNTGEPIPADDLARVFDRFYRASGRSGSRDGSHAGLGLAIARAITEASGGSVSAASDRDGTRFSIRLPAAG